MPIDPREFERAFRSMCRYDEHLGLELTVEGPGRAWYHLTVAEHHASSGGVCHGGVLAGMMDAALGLNALSWAVTQGRLCATVEFKINYIQPARVGDRLIATAEIDFTGAKLVVVHGRIEHVANGRLLATGMGTFNLYAASKQVQLAALVTQRPAG